MGVYLEDLTYKEILPILARTGKLIDTRKIIEIDLVRCGECKYMRKYALRSDEPTGIWCHRWSVPRLVTDDDFCSYGERRADDSNT